MIVKTNDKYYKAIAQAIREKTGTDQKYLPREMANAIQSISVGGKANNWNEILTGVSKDFYDKDATNLIASSFQGNIIVSSVSFPKVSTAGANVFRSSSSLKSIYVPILQMAMDSFAYSCRILSIVYIPSIMKIGDYAFSQDTSLSAVILGGTQVVSLSSSNAFDNSGISAGTGYVYVPDELVDQYKVATNWSTYASQIKPLSEIPPDVQAWLDEQEAM